MSKKEQNSYRLERVASLIQSALMEILRKGKTLDERLLNCPLNITRVKVTADLRIANCYFVPFNTPLKTNQLLDALKASSKAIRALVTEKINLKYSPEINFFSDQNYEKINQVEQILQKIKKES